MTKMVTEQAMKLLAKSVEDIAGEEKRIADALVSSLKISGGVFGISPGFAVHDLDVGTRRHLHSRACEIVAGATVH